MSTLNDLNNEQREEYYQKICKSFDLDPGLRLLDFIWVPRPDGLQDLVLYAKRGAAEVLRNKRGISVTKMTKEESNGCVSFLVEGTDKTGRVECAVGSHSVDGLRGDKLAFAIMTASTRALRRLTLQFCGNGVLDESEVSPQTVNISAVGGSLAQLSGTPTVLPPPQVLPSAMPGKDITQSQNDTRSAQISAPVTSESVSFVPQTATQMSSAQILAPEKLIEAVKQAVMEPTPVPATSTVSTGSPAPETAIGPAKKRRGRGPGKKKNTVDISSPGQTAIPPGQIDAQGIVRPVDESAKCLDCGQALKDHEYTHGKGYSCKTSVPPATAKVEEGAVGTGLLEVPPLAESKTEYQVPFPPHVGLNVVVVPDGSIPPEAKITVSVASPKIDPTAMASFNTRFRHYVNEVLPKGGMMPSEGMGIVAKARKFAASYSGAKDTTYVDTQQWEDLLSFLDDYTAKNGATQLVNYINKFIGV